MKVQEYLQHLQERHISISKEYKKFSASVSSNVCEKYWLVIDRLSERAIKFTPDVNHEINVDWRDKRIPKELKEQYKKMKKIADDCDTREESAEIKKRIQWLRTTGVSLCRQTKDPEACSKYIERKVATNYNQLKRV